MNAPARRPQVAARLPCSVSLFQPHWAEGGESRAGCGRPAGSRLRGVLPLSTPRADSVCKNAAKVRVDAECRGHPRFPSPVWLSSLLLVPVAPELLEAAC